MSVVDGLSNRRDSRGRNYNEIEAQFLRAPQGGGCRHDFCGAIGENRTYLSGTDRFVNVFSATWFTRRKITAWNHAVSRLCPNIPLSLMQYRGFVHPNIFAAIHRHRKCDTAQHYAERADHVVPKKGHFGENRAPDNDRLAHQHRPERR
jgi:hypothetical protein